MDFLTPEEFNALPTSDKKYTYKYLYESWVLKGSKIKRLRENENTQTADRIRGADETNLNKGVTQVNKYIIETWWTSMHQGKYLTRDDLFKLQRKKFEGKKSKCLTKGTVRNWLTSMNAMWDQYAWTIDQLDQFDKDVRTHKNPRKKQSSTQR